MSSHLPNLLFLLALLLTPIIHSYDLTYTDTANCQDLCDRDYVQICDWLYNSFSIDDVDCHDMVSTYCVTPCSTAPQTTIGCGRCTNYKTESCSWFNSQQDCDDAYAGCFEDCNCIETCTEDYVFCRNYLSEWVSGYNCKTIISANCYYPCRAGTFYQAAQRAYLYQQYCYDTHILSDDTLCENLIWPALE